VSIRGKVRLPNHPRSRYVCIPCQHECYSEDAPALTTRFRYLNVPCQHGWDSEDAPALPARLRCYYFLCQHEWNSEDTPAFTTRSRYVNDPCRLGWDSEDGPACGVTISRVSTIIADGLVSSVVGLLIKLVVGCALPLDRDVVGYLAQEGGPRICPSGFVFS